MNCSSIVLLVENDRADELIAKINQSDICEYHLHENNKIVITIEAENTEKEVMAVKELQAWDGVVSAEIVYSYCEDNIKILQDNVEFGTDVPGVLTDDSIPAEKIKYNGDLKKKDFR